jgi:hypothetical protein
MPLQAPGRPRPKRHSNFRPAIFGYRRSAKLADESCPGTSEKFTIEDSTSADAFVNKFSLWAKDGKVQIGRVASRNSVFGISNIEETDSPPTCIEPPTRSPLAQVTES